MIQPVDVSINYSNVVIVIIDVRTQHLHTSCLHATRGTFNECIWMVPCTELYTVVDIHMPSILTTGMKIDC